MSVRSFERFHMLHVVASLASGLLLLTMLTSGQAIAKDGTIEINGIVQSKPASLVGVQASLR